MDLKTRKEQIIKLVNSDTFRELSSFYTQKSFFNILNISRKEMAHSDFLAWLFNPNSNHELGSCTLCKLLETIIIPLNREQKLNKEDKFPEDLEDVIISGNYSIQNIEVEREKTSVFGSIDIYIQMDVLIQIDPENKKSIRIILENKVKSKEGESQTTRYYEWAKKQDKTDGFRSIFVFLTPLNNVEFERLTEPECECKNYIQINYQYLMDYVIEPCRKMKLPHEVEIFIDNYIRTLSFPALQKGINENTDEDREKINNGLEVVIKTSTRDNTRYRFNGVFLSKNRLVLAVVKKYVEEHQGITFEELKKVFSDELQGTRWGVIRKKEDAEEVFTETRYHRYFDKDEEIIDLSDAQVAVCNQWGKPRIDEFVKQAIELGFEVTIE